MTPDDIEEDIAEIEYKEMQRNGQKGEREVKRKLVTLK